MSSRLRKQQRLQSARLHRTHLMEDIDTRDPNAIPPNGAVIADPAQLKHNNTCGQLPRLYVDRAVICRNCGTEEVWPAERQKWWYEVAKGNINTEAVYCRQCRENDRIQKTEARRVH